MRTFRSPPPFLAPLLLLLLSLLLAHPASATSLLFCKCTCGANSTIIPLPALGGSCGDCNRSFCIDYNLPICRDVKEEDVVTVCFRACFPSSY